MNCDNLDIPAHLMVTCEMQYLGWWSDVVFLAATGIGAVSGLYYVVYNYFYSHRQSELRSLRNYTVELEALNKKIITVEQMYIQQPSAPPKMYEKTTDRLVDLVTEMQTFLVRFHVSAHVLCNYLSKSELNKFREVYSELTYCLQEYHLLGGDGESRAKEALINFYLLLRNIEKVGFAKCALKEFIKQLKKSKE